MADYAQINNDRANAVKPYNPQNRNPAPKDSFGDFLKAREHNGPQPESSDARTGSGTEENDGQKHDYREQLREHMEEMIDRIKSGTIQPKIAIGAQEYTQEEWKKLLEKFDDAEETIEEELRERIEALKIQADKEKPAKEEESQEEE